MRLSVNTIAKTLGLPCGGSDFAVSRVVLDSREAGEGCLFTAIEGERVDGHRFIPDLDARFDQVAFLATKPVSASHPVFVVENIEKALGALARQSLIGGPKVVGVTGSVGKTTTKEMILAVLSCAMQVSGTKGNRNNELGVPLTVLDADPDDQALVVEMGMRGLGQIQYLTDFVKPHIAVITNIGTAHLELLGTRENIARAKLELVDALDDDGCAILSGDEPLLYKARDKRCVYFGLDPHRNDYWADQIEGSAFTLHYPGGALPVKLSVAGRHQILNALAAFAVGREMGIEPALLAKGLEAFTGAGGRQRIERIGKITLIDDSYNASPESMRAALQVLAAHPHRRVAVLGDMLELGAISESAHRSLAEECRKVRVDCVLAVGKAARALYDALPDDFCKEYAETTKGAEPILRQLLQPGDTVLCKASHALQFEYLTQVVRERMEK